MNCFHCGSPTPSNPGRCACVSCSGKCEACAGRARFEKEAAAIDKYRVDVRDMASWELVQVSDSKRQRRLRIIQQLNQEAA